MIRARYTAILFVVLAVTVIVASGTVAADQVPEPDVGYDTVSEANANTSLEKTEVGYNEETESILIRQTIGSDGWSKNNQTVVYLDTDQDNTTGVSRDFLTDGSAREEYYNNLDDIGADYVAVAGGTAGNATYESTPIELREVDDLAVEVNGNNVELAIDTENIEGSDIFDFKVAYIKTPDNITSTDNFDFHPDPDNSENRSLTFDTAEGIVGTSVQFGVSGTTEGPGYGEVDVNVNLINDNDETVDSETLTVGESSGDSITFDRLSAADFDDGEIEATVATELTNYKLNLTDSSQVTLAPGERASKSASIEFLSPQVEFNVTNGTNSDGVSPFTGEIDYNETGETFSFNITLANNSNNNNVTIVRNTIEFNRTDRVEINRSDPIDTAGSILQTDVPGSTGVDVSNKNFLDDGTGGFEFTVRPEDTENGTGVNGTIAQINMNTTIDPGVADPDSVEISHNAIVTTNQSDTFETVIASNTTKINQTFDKVEVANAELVTEQNMVNATLLISATAESPAPNNGKIQNITLYNNSGHKVDNVTCSTPFDSDCSGTLIDTPTQNTSADQNATVQYNTTNYTVKAFGTGSPPAYSSDKTNISEKIFVEGDVGSAGRTGVDGNVTLADILIVQNNLGADNGGEFPYADPVAGVSDVDNSGSVSGTDLQKVVNEAY